VSTREIRIRVRWNDPRLLKAAILFSVSSSLSFYLIKISGDDRTVEITEAHVANWFRNRRKMKKNIDGCNEKGSESYEHLVEMSMDGSENGAEHDIEISVEDITENGVKVKSERSPRSSPSNSLIESHSSQPPVNQIQSRFNPSNSTMAAQA